MAHDCSIPYGGGPRTINATVNAPSIVKGMADQKVQAGKAIAEHAKLSKHKNGKGTRSLKHTITEEIHKDGLTEKQKLTVSTKRTNR